MPDAVPAFVWVEDLGASGEPLTLDDTAGHHVARVCRARLGDSLTLTDGRGSVARGRVAALSPRVSVEVEAVERIDRTTTSVLLCGAPEGQRFDWLVEKLAELGVARVRPVDCARGAWPRAAFRPERWKRVAVAALEQSRGRFLLEIEPPVDLAEALEAEAGLGLGILADPVGEAIGKFRPSLGGVTGGMVGPAGGFTEDEKTSILGRGWVSASLATARLRTETAALSWASWWALPR